MVKYEIMGKLVGPAKLRRVNGEIDNRHKMVKEVKMV